MSTASSRTAIGLREEPALSENARAVLEARYLKKNERGECVETPADLFQRVAKTVADIEILYGGDEMSRRNWEHRFYRLLTSGVFMPNSPTLMNAGREMGMLSACFVLPVRDSITEIFNSIKHTALIQKAGGGTGFAFDELRPTGDYIKSSGGTTSGPISFWRTFSEATNAIQQGAFRRGANMGMMYIHHPDILKFLHAKQDLDQFTNYNISVKVTNDWMDAFLDDADSPHVVRNPRSGQAFVITRDIDIWKYTVRDLIEIECVEPVPPTGREKYYRTPRLTGPLPDELRGKVYTKRDVWNIIVNNAWQTGEPGVVFMDRINEDNPTPQVGRIEATNPCGEQPLLPYEACNLGSLNLGLFVKDGCTPAADVDWDGLREAVRDATRFLDNVIDANNYPLPEIEQICRDNRKIGLGVMGFADAMFKLGVAYNSEEGVAWAERFMRFINDEAHHCSEELARERGCFPNWQGSVWHTRHSRMMRNAAVTTVAPTGTISIIANCSGGIEPLFSLAFMRNILKGQKQGEKPLVEVNDTFRAAAQVGGFNSDELIERIIRAGSLAHLDEVPEEVKRVFVCAHDITPEWHMRMQAAFQKHCDASISKTINFPHSATREDVDGIYQLAYRMRCKGVTVYRDGCRPSQPMVLMDDDTPATNILLEVNEAQQHGESESEVRPQAGAAGESSAAVRVESPTADPGPAAPPNIGVPLIEPMDLPEIVSGLRIRQMTPFGNMHVKITVDPRANREQEVFAQLGKGGDVANGDLEAICRMISLWLRAGGSLQHVIKQLEGIGTSLQIPTRAGRIMSLGDGLACALKKYTRAKEHFGLRLLLLGEINLAELDNPNPAPHHPETTPVDRPVPPGNGKNAQTVSKSEAAAVQRRMESSAVRSTQRGGAQSSQSKTPKAMRVAGGNGNGNGNGHGSGTTETAVAVIELDDAADTVTVVEMRSKTTVLDSADATVAEVRTLEAADLSAVLGEVRHKHDSATHYKVMCPECGNALVLQEGCRTCPSCGWAAC
ncbi:MAG: adenosylcobalamin-dependent ribonucleoside-diphosphate reductase [Phycisphaerae bacterium]|nr:adenosylcobalamin-dependent ribonucleoside-diphosphate reductase [Phycisphaerae bacterium]